MNQKTPPEDSSEDEPKIQIDSQLNIGDMSGGRVVGTNIGHITGEVNIYTDNLGDLQGARLRRKPLLAGYPSYVPDPKPGEWVRCGGPYGGLIRALAADPSDPKVIFAGIDLPGWDMGLYRSLDKGLTWERADDGIPKPSVISLAVSLHDHVIYAGTNTGAYLSRDGGGTWEILDARLVGFEVRCLALAAGDPYQRFLGTGKYSSGGTAFSAGSISGVKSEGGELALSPSQDPNSGGAHFSSDGGLTWETYPIRNVNAAVFAPSDSGVFYLGTSETGLYRRDHGRWRQIKIPGTRSIFELGVSPDDPDHLLAGCDRGIFQSFDGGESWDVVRGTPAVQFSAIQFDPEDGNIIYIAGVPGVYASRDRGVSWQLINRGLVHTRVMKLALSLEGDLYAGSDGGGVFFKSKRSTAWMSRSQGLSMQQQGLSLAALDEGILYAGTSTAIYRSENAGKSWSEVGYLDARPVTALALPKQPARHVGTQAPGLIATSDAGHSWQAVSLVQSAPLMIAANSLGDIYRSRDGGYEWELVYKHDPKHFEAAIWRMDFSPLDANLALGAAGQAGLLRSQDAGLTWERVSGDLPNKPVPIVAWSPHTRGEAILWMAGEGICRTHDSGKSWEIAGLAFAQIPVLSLAYCPHEPGRIYAGSQQGDLFILDSGSAWQPDRKVHLTEGKMLALVFSPDDHQTMLAATSRGIFLSRDRATSWQPFNAGLIPDDPVVNTLLFSPHDPNRLFAGLQIGVFTGRLPET